MAAIDPSRLWANQTGLDPNAPPIFNRSDLTYNAGQALGGGDAGSSFGAGPGWVMNAASDAYNASPDHWGSGENWNIGGDANAPVMAIKNGNYQGMNYQYGLDPTGQYWVPGAGQQSAMGDAAYGANFWTPIIMAATAGYGAYAGAGAGAADAGAAGAGIDATGGAETAIGGSSYGGAGGYGAGVGAGSAPGYGGVGTSGAGAGTDAVAAPTTVTPTTGSGLFGTGMNAGDAVKLGSLAAGLLGGKKGGAGGSGAGANYSVTNPMIPLSQLQGMSGGGGGMLGGAGSMRPTMQTPNYGPNVTSPSQAMWQQYASGLFGRPQGSMPQQAGPGMLAQMPMVQGKPVARSGPYGG